MSKGKSVRVRFLTSLVGSEESFSPGQEYDVSAEWAAKIADGVRAVVVEPTPAKKSKKSKLENASASAENVERAVEVG